MRLDAAAHARLAELAPRFAGPAHGAALARARDQVAADLDDPLSALALLVALPGGPTDGHAHDPGLAAVGEWLEARFEAEPGVDAARLHAELAWLTALARAAALDPQAAPKAGPQLFGAQLANLRRAREEALIAQAAAAEPVAPAIAAAETPEPEPEAEPEAALDDPLMGFAVPGMDLGGMDFDLPPPPEPAASTPADEPAPADDLTPLLGDAPTPVRRNALVSWPPEAEGARDALKHALADALRDDE